MSFPDALNFIPVFVLVFFRTAGLMLAAPLFGSAKVPKRLKVMFALVMAAGLVNRVKVAPHLPGTTLELAAGIHTGEIEIRNAGFAGLTVHIAENISSKARAGEILVSGVVADLVAGSGLHFQERGVETFDGMPGELRLLAVADVQHLEPARMAAKSPHLNVLSAREREVLALVADGLSNAAIAKRLSLSDHTIKRHVANILLKLDLPTRAAAAALVGRTSPRGGL